MRDSTPRPATSSEHSTETDSQASSDLDGSTPPRSQTGRHQNHAKGSAHGRSKLTEEQVIAIRQEWAAGSVRREELATRYAIGMSPLKRILSGEAWSHVPMAGSRAVISDEERFASNFRRGSDNECWIWTGGQSGDPPYGSFSHTGSDGKRIPIKAHRFAYELKFGTIRSHDKCVCHTCDTPLCVNPSHLFLGTKKDNTDDMFAKGRESDRKGLSNGRALLKEDDVSAIRAAAARGVSQESLAEAYGVGQTAISKIVLRQTWSHLP